MNMTLDKSKLACILFEISILVTSKKLRISRFTEDEFQTGNTDYTWSNVDCLHFPVFIWQDYVSGKIILLNETD